MKSVAWWISAFVTVSIAVVLVAQAPALDVKMGLWEMTTASEIGGQPPTLDPSSGIDTSKMTPQQKAMMESAMKGMMGRHTDVSKSCITKEKLQKSAFMMENQPDDQTCKQTLTTNTRSSLAATVTCTGKETMTGQMHFDALSPTAIKGTMTMSGLQGGHPSTLTMTMTGKWLSADCGGKK